MIVLSERLKHMPTLEYRSATRKLVKAGVGSTEPAANRTQRG